MLAVPMAATQRVLKFPVLMIRLNASSQLNGTFSMRVSPRGGSRRLLLALISAARAGTALHRCSNEIASRSDLWVRSGTATVAACPGTRLNFSRRSPAEAGQYAIAVATIALASTELTILTAFSANFACAFCRTDGGFRFLFMTPALPLWRMPSSLSRAYQR